MRQVARSHICTASGLFCHIILPAVSHHIMLRDKGTYVYAFALAVLGITSLYLNLTIVDRAKAIQLARSSRTGQWLTRTARPANAYCE